ncbi:MAG: type I-G CRISPR-associated helicase/endonuclease Cas3g [Acidithiobacillus ferrivorans]
MNPFDEIEVLVPYLCQGRRLYPWQRRLLVEWLLRGTIPDAVDIPTGLGKTLIMVLWMIARMVGIPLPRRLVYIVDRRAVVDQASKEAEALAAALSSLLKNENVELRHRDRWRANLGIGQSTTITISTLRGNLIDNRKWLERPHACAIIVGTVDMIGSRLLFSGYGVSPGMRPVHAGLLGCDAIMVLDEAHLVPPFEALLRGLSTIIAHERAASPIAVPAFELTTLSATGRDLAGLTVFELNEEDEKDQPTMSRLEAEKKLRVLPQVESQALAEALAGSAWTVSERTRRVVVFCNSRKTAQEVEAILAARVREELGKDTQLTELFVGERRVRERTLLYESNDDAHPTILSRFRPTESTHDYTQPVFLVATSAAEVGIDLDADDLVCDLVPWERMVQRFGRVNRRPEGGSARIEIIPSISEKEAEDGVAKERLAELKAPFESSAWPHDEMGMLDASPLTLKRLKTIPSLAALIDLAMSPTPLHPAISEPVLDAWAMTSLREHPGRPNVDPWIRGWVDKRPQSRIAWRKHFPLRLDFQSDLETAKSEMSAFFEAAPPHITEILEAPTDRIVDMLRRRAKALLGIHGADPDGPRNHEPIVAVIEHTGQIDIWPVSRIQKENQKTLQRKWAERLIVVDARFGCLDQIGLLDSTASDPPMTIDDESEDWKLSLESTTQWRIKYGKPASRENYWRKGDFVWVESPDDEDSDELWVDFWRGGGAMTGDAAVAKKAQVLAEHHEWIRCESQKIANGIGLEAKAGLLAAAAALHDAGKDRELWQNAMNAERTGRPFAKTVGGASPRSLAGYRHEFGSLSDAMHNALIQSLPSHDRDLSLHLIASHHGYARPIINAFDPLVAPTDSDKLAQEATLRYIRLQGIWGHWGLAWWESLLRASDWAASRRVNSDD